MNCNLEQSSNKAVECKTIFQAITERQAIIMTKELSRAVLEFSSSPSSFSSSSSSSSSASSSSASSASSTCSTSSSPASSSPSSPSPSSPLSSASPSSSSAASSDGSASSAPSSSPWSPSPVSSSSSSSVLPACLSRYSRTTGHFEESHPPTVRSSCFKIVSPGTHEQRGISKSPTLPQFVRAASKLSPPDDPFEQLFPLPRNIHSTSRRNPQQQR